MKKVTRQEMIDFILAQPPEKEFNMNQSSSDSECGCIMVHYARSNLNLITSYQSYQCGCNEWYSNSGDLAQLEVGIFDMLKEIQDEVDFSNDETKSVSTYGFLQSKLKESEEK